MSRQELVSAYLEGGISRRSFIRKLVATGVTFGAAVSYAHLLTPERAKAALTNADFYRPEPKALVLSTKVKGVLDDGGLELLLEVEEPATLQIIANAVVRGKPVTIALGQATFAVAGSQLITLPLTQAGKKILRRKKKKGQSAEIDVLVQATDKQGLTGQFASGPQQLRRSRRRRRKNP